MTAGTRPSYLQDMADVERRLRDVERATARIPARLGGGGGGVSFQWIRVDGGHILNASPEVLGIKGSPTEITDFTSLNPGRVNKNTGQQTEAPQGTWPDGYGYGTYAIVNGLGISTYERVILRYRSATVARCIIEGWIFWTQSVQTMTYEFDGEEITVKLVEVAP